MSEFETNFIGYSSRGGQNSDSDFLVPTWNFTNNIAAIASYPKVFFFQLKCPPGMKKICFLVVR